MRFFGGVGGDNAELSALGTPKTDLRPTNQYIFEKENTEYIHMTQKVFDFEKCNIDRLISVACTFRYKVKKTHSVI